MDTIDALMKVRNALVMASANLEAEWEMATNEEEKHALWLHLLQVRKELAFVKRAILDLLQEAMTIRPPSQPLIDRTEVLVDAVQKQVIAIGRAQAIIKLVSELGKLAQELVNG